MSNDYPFACEYAKSNRAACKSCKDLILKDSLRLAIMVQSHHFDGKIPNWFHPSCFWGKKVTKPMSEADFHGFDALRWEDQQKIREKLGTAAPDSAASSSKRKADDPSAAVSGKTKKQKSDANGGVDKAMLELKKQVDDLYKIRDKLKGCMNKRELAELLECNNQQIPVGEDKILDRLTDCMLFGAPLPCPTCQTCPSTLIYSTSNNAYMCSGHISEYTRCQYSTQDPARKDFVIPDDFKEIEYLNKFKFKPGRKRVFPATKSAPSTSATPQKSASSLPVGKPLAKLTFAVSGKHFSTSAKEVAQEIRSLGGSVTTTMNTAVLAIVSTQQDYDDMAYKPLKVSQDLKIPVVKEEFLQTVPLGAKSATEVVEVLNQHAITLNSADIGTKLETILYAKSGKAKEDKAWTKSVPTSTKLTIKGGAAVDPDSGLEDKASIYSDGKGNVYNAVLRLFDLQSNQNSFYKLQLLKHDQKEKFWVFRAWGRVGTTIGGSKLEPFASKQAAIDHFEFLFLDKTGNHFKNRKAFVKYPGKFDLMDIDYGEHGLVKSNVEPGSKTKLAKAIQRLISMIFDIEQMEEAMKEFEIDLAKMPLGKISKKQIESAYKILTELQQLISEGKHDNVKILDASNRFYSIVPQDLGMRAAPLLDNLNIIKSKVDMLDCLNEIEIAYSILKSDSKADAEKDPIDVHYEKLKTKIEVVDKSSEEFQQILTYATNSHAPTHDQYALEITDVYKITRSGELQRYTPFKALPNRMLLWHGSRTSNCAGILTQGLRIAPPEAPVTGYMFGKGIYFADMISKSANYCMASRTNPVGLLLLSEVALGNMYERTKAEFVEKLPKGKHSVKGIGMTMPNPSETVTLPDGTTVPLGKPVKNEGVKTQLLYNEYIVYDIAQVNQRYLVEVKFNWKK